MSKKNERKAKIVGNIDRELASFVDNESSSNSDDSNINFLQGDDIDRSPSSSSTGPSSAPPPIPFQSDATGDLLQSNTEGSPSPPISISPPLAPAPPPCIIDETELKIEFVQILDMVKEKQLLQQKREELEREVAAVEKKQNEIEYYLIDIGRKHCFLSLQINGAFAQDIVIKLYYEQAPITSQYFRSICTNQDGLGYENTAFKFLKIDEYIEGGDKEIYHRNGERLFYNIPKEQDQKLAHDKPGLVSMGVNDGSTKFIITLELSEMGKSSPFLT